MKRPVIISLLILALGLVCTGILAVILFTASNRLSINNPFDKRNISSQVEESKTLKVDAEKPVTLKVFSDAGSVSVTGGDVETVQVRAVKTAYDSSKARADAEVKTVKYTIEQTGNTITIKYELAKSMNFSNNVNTVDFIIIVPNQATVDVDNHFGEVTLSNLQGGVLIQNSFGEISLDQIEGAVSVSTNSGGVTASSIDAGEEDIELKSEFGSITLKNANGKNVTLDSNSGKIDLNEVNATGSVTSTTDFGDSVFENGSANSLSVVTKSGGVTLTKVNVNQAIKVQNDFGGIELNQSLAASYDLHTNSGTITVDGAKGKLKALTDFGGLKIQNTQAATLDLETKSGSVEFDGSLGDGPHIVQSDFGNIDLTLPADSKLDVDLSTSFGKIKSDLPITVTVTESSEKDGDQIVGTINGGGEQLTAKTNSGSVNIHASK